MFCKRFAWGIGLSAMVATGAPASASDAIYPLDALPSYREDIFSSDRWGVGVGAFVGFEPAYEGADEFRAVAYPLIFPRYFGSAHDPAARSRVAFRGLDDIRVAAVRLGGLDLGPVAGYRFKRDEDVSARLDGLGDVKGGLTLGGFAAYHFEPFFVDVAYVRQVTGGDNGHTIRIGAGIDQPVSDAMTLRAYLNSSYASQGYMDSYFSVSAAQAAASTAGLAAFDAGAGFKDIGVDLGVDYRVNDRLTLRSSAGYSRLINDAAISPVTANRHQFSGGIGMIYTFGRTD